MTTLTSDYIVVGGGTAGCVLAARLSSEPGTRVVLLEAGEASGPAEMAYPDPLAAFGLWGSSVDWAYSTTAQAGTEDAVHAWPRGRVLGGSSAINGMVHHRGHPDSYDAWEKQGATDWNYNALLPFFRRSERAEGRDPQVRGTDGPMRIEASPAPNPLAEAAFRAAVEAGHTPLDDGNGRGSEGVSWRERNVADGRRQSAAEAYLRPVLARPNLTVITGAYVRRLVLENGRCRGVEYSVAGEVRTVLSDRETVLAAGTIGSPHLLMLSGIGPVDHLWDVGVEVVADLQGVGGNLHDHVTSYVVHGSDRQPPSGPSAEAQVLTRSSDGVAPDLLLLFAGAALRPRWTGADLGGYSILFSLMDPYSRGTLRLQSSDPTAAPLIDPAYLSDDRDLDRLLVGLRLARELGGTEALAPWRTVESFPGVDVQDEESCRAYLRSTASTYFHPVGTCRMGMDELAVVDPQLRVRSIEGLRVADASVMPSGSSAEYKGALWTIPSAYIETLPVQRPRPPVLLGGFTPATLERIGRRADGWAGVGLPVPQLAYVIGQIRQIAEANGRDPDALRTVVRVNPVVTAEAAPNDAVPHRGTVAQVSDYLLAAHAAGADEVLIDLQQTARSPHEVTDLAHRFHELLSKG